MKIIDHVKNDILAGGEQYVNFRSMLIRRRCPSLMIHCSDSECSIREALNFALKIRCIRGVSCQLCWDTPLKSVKHACRNMTNPDYDLTPIDMVILNDEEMTHTLKNVGCPQDFGFDIICGDLSCDGCWELEISREEQITEGGDLHV